MGAQLDRMMEAEKQRKAKKGLVVDRTSSMTAFQVERFWINASQRLFTAIQESLPTYRGDAGLALQTGCDAQLLAAIAAKALEDTIGK